jgi:hypothetical protein
MAFSSSGYRIYCGICNQQYKVFQCWESALFSPEIDEPEPENINTVESAPNKKTRICSGCELKEREKLFAKKVQVSDQEWLQECKPGWSSMQEVLKDMKQQQRGIAWKANGMHYAQAVMIVAKMDGAQKMSKKDKGRLKTSTAKKLAENFLKVIINGTLFSAFQNAGNRITKHMASSAQLQQAYRVYISGPCKDRLAKLEELEAKEEDYLKGRLYV